MEVLTCGGCSSIGRAPDCGSGCCGFESHHPPQTKRGDRGCPRPPFFTFLLGRSQVVRQGTLTPSSAGSSPAVPARFFAQALQINDPVAQSAEQLPFKQWVRGSNPRRVTKNIPGTATVSGIFCCCGIPPGRSFRSAVLSASLFHGISNLLCQMNIVKRKEMAQCMIKSSIAV